MIKKLFPTQAFTLREHRLLFENPEAAKPPVASENTESKEKKESDAKASEKAGELNKDTVKTAAEARTNGAQAALDAAQKYAQQGYEFAKKNVAPAAKTVLTPLVGPAVIHAGETIASHSEAVIMNAQNVRTENKSVSNATVEKKPDAQQSEPGTPENIPAKITALKEEQKENEKKLEDKKLPPEERSTLQERQTQIDEELNKLNPPKTHGEKFTRDLNSAIKELSHAQGMDKFAAFVKVMALISTLWATVSKWNEKYVPEAEKKEEAPKGPDTPENRLSAKLKANEKKMDGTVKDEKVNLQEIKDQNKKEREANTKNSDDMTKRIDGAKKEKEVLIDRKAELEKNLTSAKEEETKNINDQIKIIVEQIAIQDKVIALTTERDALLEKNKKLDEEDTVINKRFGIEDDKKLEEDKKPEETKEEKPTETPEQNKKRTDAAKQFIANAATLLPGTTVTAGKGAQVIIKENGVTLIAVPQPDGKWAAIDGTGRGWTVNEDRYVMYEGTKAGEDPLLKKIGDALKEAREKKLF